MQGGTRKQARHTSYKHPCPKERGLAPRSTHLTRPHRTQRGAPRRESDDGPIARVQEFAKRRAAGEQGGRRDPLDATAILKWDRDVRELSTTQLLLDNKQ